jgi:hypothetical protein
MIKHFSFKALLATAILACSFSQAGAAEIGGIKFDDTTKVAGKDLKLNGVGLRTRFGFKVYAAGLYLTEKKSKPADIVALDGPRRVTLVMMREISSEDFGEAFMAGLNANSDKAEKTKILPQIGQFGAMFQLFPSLKKGDVLHLDWIPGSGTQCELNGKKVGEVAPDLAFFNAVLKIWIGEKPVDSGLKPGLLGEKS